MAARITGLCLLPLVCGAACGLVWLSVWTVTPLLPPRISRSHGPCSEMLFLAEECAGALDHRDAGKHVLCPERPLSIEPSLDRDWAHGQMTAWLSLGVEN